MPPVETLAQLRERARACRGCELWANATQTVFGEGPADAAILFVGEQPGDQEDLRGRPFVGPAGQLFDRALLEAGIDREQVYVTNAVKHFKFVPRGKRRLHQKPDYGETLSCRPWLTAEFAAVAATVIVVLGATAAHALMGRQVTIGRERGRFHPFPSARYLYVTVHPSYLLRLPDPRAQAVEYGRFVADLRRIAAGPSQVEPAPRQQDLF